MNEEKLKKFFDKQVKQRNIKFSKDLIIKYEQTTKNNWIKKLLNIKENDIILNAGCGNTTELLVFSSTIKNFKIIGVDLSFQMLFDAKTKITKEKNLYLINCNLQKLPFKKNTFNKIICSEVIEHIENNRILLNEFRQVLKNEGEIIITTPNKISLYGIEKYVRKKILKLKTKHPYDEWSTKNSLIELLNKNGFEINYISSCCFLPPPIFSYNLPHFIKKILFKIMKNFEEILNFFFKFNGYILICKAKRMK
ncbi:MAG TPA: class I SAM-dependent methyltransferase [bacterium]|nr:class I SAM-dependent methyltransferase [bacterium]HOL47790.1 class I SAM-dependent methyltransferase [bacterium]HPQ18625.1 class I SAM-dependent methyltransferase [bacterium]